MSNAALQQKNALLDQYGFYYVEETWKYLRRDGRYYVTAQIVDSNSYSSLKALLDSMEKM